MPYCCTPKTVESVAAEMLSELSERHALLPSQQIGARRDRSTTTALDFSRNSELQNSKSSSHQWIMAFTNKGSAQIQVPYWIPQGSPAFFMFDCFTTLKLLESIPATSNQRQLLALRLTLP